MPLRTMHHRHRLALGCALVFLLRTGVAGAAGSDPPPADPEREALEREMFGEPPDPKAPTAPQPAAKPTEGAPSTDRDAWEDELFGGGDADMSSDMSSDASADAPIAADPTAADSGPAIDFTDYDPDPLQIGGQIYLRSTYTIPQGTGIDEQSLQMPNLVDLYFDARPSSRVRAFVRGRLYYDPTYDPDAATNPLFAAPDNPRVLLDQLWIRFDIARAVFVTLGAQRIRWGPSLIWNPADIVHPVRRNPVAIFDERVGTTLLKVHVPVESLGWNFYAIALLDHASKLDRIGGAFRAEFVVSTVELGLSASVRKDTKPRVALDVSAGLWDIDIYTEAALHVGTNRPRYTTPVDYGAVLTGADPATEEVGDDLFVEATGGLQWSTLYDDQHLLTLGAEYNFNSFGYADPDVYPLLIYKGQFSPFYVGRHYAAVFVNLQAPSSWSDASFTLFQIGNLSDLSFATRLNVVIPTLTYLQVETFVGVSYGERSGELRLGIDLLDSIRIPPQLFSMGINLRVRI